MSERTLPAVAVIEDDESTDATRGRTRPTAAVVSDDAETTGAIARTRATLAPTSDDAVTEPTATGVSAGSGASNGPTRNGHLGFRTGNSGGNVSTPAAAPGL